MIILIVIILIIALAIYGCFKYRQGIVNYLQHSRWGSMLLSWLHSVIFDFKMEDPDQVPKQITFGFIAIVVVIAVISFLLAGSNQ